MSADQPDFTVFFQMIVGPRRFHPLLILLRFSASWDWGPALPIHGDVLETFRVPAVYLRLALWESLAYWA
jgi:hypothetical protein